METSDFYVLVEGPTWGDAQFYGEWLLAAAKAQLFWTDAVKDQQFAKEIERLRVAYEPDFGIAATVMLMNLRGHWTTFVLDLLYSEEGEEFVMMAGIGLFVPSGRAWRMTIPPVLTSETVKNAALAFARTEDREYILHPEQLVTCMSRAEAKVLQKQVELFQGSRGEQPYRLQ
jgi:hypothetical protein